MLLLLLFPLLAPSAPIHTTVFAPMAARTTDVFSVNA